MVLMNPHDALSIGGPDPSSWPSPVELYRTINDRANLIGIRRRDPGAHLPNDIISYYEGLAVGLTDVMNEMRRQFPGIHDLAYDNYGGDDAS